MESVQTLTDYGWTARRYSCAPAQHQLPLSCCSASIHVEPMQQSLYHLAAPHRSSLELHHCLLRFPVCLSEAGRREGVGGTCHVHTHHATFHRHAGRQTARRMEKRDQDVHSVCLIPKTVISPPHAQAAAPGVHPLCSCLAQNAPPDPHRWLQGCELRCHHPSCVRALTVCGLHSKDQPWGKMDAKNTSQQLSRDGVVMHCLNAGCGGRLIRTAIEKDRGVRRAEVWYHAKWHQAIIEEEERQKKVQEEEAARARAEADELRRKEEKAAEIEAKKAAKQAAKVAKEAARRPDLVGLDGVQVRAT